MLEICGITTCHVFQPNPRGFSSIFSKDLKNPHLVIVNPRGFGTVEILILMIFGSLTLPQKDLQIPKFEFLHINANFSRYATCTTIDMKPLAY